MALAVSEMHLNGRRMFTGIVHDLTARVQAEESVRRARDELEVRVRERTAELEEANEEIRRFAYIVSHDLRAPLVNLQGFASELRTAADVLQAALPAALPHLEAPQGADVACALEQDIPEALDFIETSVTRMDHLIRAILHLSRLGRRELTFESLDMGALVHGTVQTLAHQIAQRQVQVTVEPLPTVSADRTAMEQIMGNLLANAVAYLAPGRPGEIVITGERHPSVTVFAVRDNGRGIATDDISKVFEPFRRVGRQDGPGEGMGLAYVRMLVRRHGGEIRCHSTLGVGTTFTFTIAHQIT
jgi:signal transduction histidine kinase